MASGDADSLTLRSLPSGSVSLPVRVVTKDGSEERTDLVSIEEPLEIRLCHGKPQREMTLSITMRTPGQDLELAVGFLHGEGVIASPRDVLDVAHCGPPSPDKSLQNVVKVTLRPEVEVAAQTLERHFYTTSSCGVCGKTSIDAVQVRIPARTRQSEFAISRETLGQVPGRLRAQQDEFNRTGGLHASGLFDSDGNVVCVREDVGRHNALDKVVGARFLAGELPIDALGLVLSGRASFELVQKAAMAGIGLVAAVGTPSSLAIELAEAEGVTLIGFLSSERCNVYCHPQRLVR